MNERVVAMICVPWSDKWLGSGTEGERESLSLTLLPTAPVCVCVCVLITHKRGSGGGFWGKGPSTRFCVQIIPGGITGVTCGLNLSRDVPHHFTPSNADLLANLRPPRAFAARQLRHFNRGSALCVCVPLNHPKNSKLTNCCLYFFLFFVIIYIFLLLLSYLSKCFTMSS